MEKENIVSLFENGIETGPACSICVRLEVSRDNDQGWHLHFMRQHEVQKKKKSNVVERYSRSVHLDMIRRSGDLSLL